MNEKYVSKQTNFERTLICNAKFTILNKENYFSVRIEKDKNKIVFRTATQKARWGNFLDIIQFFKGFSMNLFSSQSDSPLSRYRS